MNTLVKKSKYEFYSTISIFIFGKIIKSHEIFKLLKNSLFNEIPQNLNPGINNLKRILEHLLTSSNVEDLRLEILLKDPNNKCL